MIPLFMNIIISSHGQSTIISRRKKIYHLLFFIRFVLWVYMIPLLASSISVSCHNIWTITMKTLDFTNIHMSRPWRIYPHRYKKKWHDGMRAMIMRKDKACLGGVNHRLRTVPCDIKCILSFLCFCCEVVWWWFGVFHMV